MYSRALRDVPRLYRVVETALVLCPLPRARMKSGQAASPPSSPTDLFLSAWDHGVSLVVLASWLANDRQGCIFSSALE